MTSRFPVGTVSAPVATPLTNAPTVKAWNGVLPGSSRLVTDTGVAESTVTAFAAGLIPTVPPTWRLPLESTWAWNAGLVGSVTMALTNVTATAVPNWTSTNVRHSATTMAVIWRALNPAGSSPPGSRLERPRRLKASPPALEPHHGGRDVAEVEVGPVPQLALVVEAPALRAAGGEDDAGLFLMHGDGHGPERHDRDRQVAVGGRSVPKLPDVVVAPALHHPGADQRAAVVVAEADG